MKLTRPIVIPGLLLVYLIVMACIGFPEYRAGRMTALYYFGTIAITVCAIVLLYFNLKRRQAARDRRRQQYESENKKSDNQQ